MRFFCAHAVPILCLVRAQGRDAILCRASFRILLSVPVQLGLTDAWTTVDRPLLPVAVRPVSVGSWSESRRSAIALLERQLTGSRTRTPDPKRNLGAWKSRPSGTFEIRGRRDPQGRRNREAQLLDGPLDRGVSAHLCQYLNAPLQAGQTKSICCAATVRECLQVGQVTTFEGKGCLS